MDANVPQFEKYWREKIAQEIADLIDSTPSVSAREVYSFVKENYENKVWS